MNEKTKVVIKDLVREIGLMISTLTWRIGYEKDTESVETLKQTQEVLKVAVRELKQLSKGEQTND